MSFYWKIKEGEQGGARGRHIGKMQGNIWALMSMDLSIALLFHHFYLNYFWDARGWSCSLQEANSQRRRSCTFPNTKSGLLSLSSQSVLFFFKFSVRWWWRVQLLRSDSLGSSLALTLQCVTLGVITSLYPSFLVCKTWLIILPPS